MTINSLINFGVPSIPTPSPQARENADKLVLRWALTTAPGTLTMNDIRKLGLEIAWELDRFVEQERSFDLSCQGIVIPPTP
jgi:hypothetical protein